MNCNVCGYETVYFDRGRVLNKYDIEYFRCPNCGQIQTEVPFWLDEAYANAITNTDIGLIQRNITFSETVEIILKVFFHDCKTFCDWGAGYGMFVRMMRDKGFDFHWYDKYCNNLFAQGYERRLKNYDLITSFEMFEHINEPYKLCDELFQYTSNLIFSTDLVPDGVDGINDWWYFAPEHGQHISFYTENSLRLLAEKYNREYLSIGALHIFSNRRISRKKLEICLKRKWVVNRLIKKQSLLQDDYKELTGKDCR